MKKVIFVGLNTINGYAIKNLFDVNEFEIELRQCKMLKPEIIQKL